MKKNYYLFIKKIFALVAFLTLNVLTLSAQYCSPSFSSGCFSWRNQSITLDAINWTIGSSQCTENDYTTDTAYLDAGSSYPMSVTNGDWCGCGVWIDFNNDLAFDTTENLFHLYTANQTNNYNFNISIPGSVPTGIYRMRIIAGWGTDCYTVSSNGYGPCGSYQYGNFDDFTVSITSLSTGTDLHQANSTLIEASPNPVSDLLTISVPHFKSTNARIWLTDITGRLIHNVSVKETKRVLDFSNLRGGIYLLNYIDGDNSQVLKIVKQDSF